MGLRANELAEAVDLDPTVVSKIETGKRAVKSVELARIAAALKVSPLALLEPDSLLGKLPLAARAAGPSVAVGAAYDRLLSLTELHVVLSENGLHSSPKLASVPSVVGLPWLTAANVLSAWAVENMPLEQEGDDRFMGLVDRIQDVLAVDVLVEPYPDDPLSGAAIMDPSFPLLFVNSAHPLPRSLFTLAHELGHILAKHSGAAITLDRELWGAGDEERAANAFAAAFLMPRGVIDGYIDRIGRNHTALVQMAAGLGVSFESLIYRLHNLGYINADMRDQLKQVNWRKLVLRMSDLPDQYGGLDRVSAARFQARSVSTPPSVLPAMLWQRAIGGYEKGVIATSALARLIGKDPSDLSEELGDGPSLEDSLAVIDAPYHDGVEEEELRFDGQPI